MPYPNSNRRAMRRNVFLLVLLLGCASSVLADVAVPGNSAGAIAYSHRLNLFWIAEKLLALSIPCAFLFTGAGARISRACGRGVRGNRWANVASFAGVYVLLDALLSLPLHYLRAQSMGWLGNQGAGAWLAGRLASELPLMAGAVIFMWIPYALMRRSPRRWWLWSAVLLVPVALFVLVVQPIFGPTPATHYAPLADQALRSQIEALAERCGIHGIPIVVGGDDTSVYGLGPTNRIILQQDLAKVESPAQIRFTVGHELKHYVLGDNWKALAIVILLLLAGFWLAQQASGVALARWHRRFGFQRLDDPASLPLLACCFSALWLAATPAFLAFSRHIEREADRFALELTHENLAAASLAAGWIGDTEPAEPDWFAYTFRWNHPSDGERIRMANAYHPWATGAPLKYQSACPVRLPAP